MSEEHRITTLIVTAADRAASEHMETLGLPGDWRDHASCKEIDRSYFFSAGHPDRSIVKLCAACPIQPVCLEFALATNAHGYWAGTTRQDRMQIARRRERKAALARAGIEVS